MKKTILIADQHALFRDTLRHYIEHAEPRYNLFMAENLDEVQDALHADAKPDLCILEFKMPGLQGVENLEELVGLYPQQRISIMSTTENSDDLHQMLSMPIAGHILKTMPGKDMLMAIDAMLQGIRYVPRSYQEAVQKKDRIMADFKLTPREKEVLDLLAQGSSNKDIADTLGLKIVTVKLHIRGILKKMECNNRTQAALKARDAGRMSGYL